MNTKFMQEQWNVIIQGTCREFTPLCEYYLRERAFSTSNRLCPFVTCCFHICGKLFNIQQTIHDVLCMYWYSGAKEYSFIINHSLQKVNIKHVLLLVLGKQRKTRLVIVKYTNVKYLNSEKSMTESVLPANTLQFLFVHPFLPQYTV